MGWSVVNLEQADAAIAVGLGALVIAAAHFGAIVVHELYEINDQLAGRSPEFSKLISGQGTGETP